MNDNYIAIRNLCVDYGDQPIIKHFNAELPKGQVTVLVGHNGSGKSTLIKTLAGILKYDGEVNYFGQNSRDGLEIGYIPQRFEVDFTLPITVFELIWLSLATCQLSHKDKQKLIKDSLLKVDLPGFKKRTLGGLSGGQLQRVLLARTLAHQPSLLLLDEPESGMDANSEISFYKLLRGLVDENEYTVVLATHNQETISNLADQVIDMDELNGQDEIATVISKRS